jgi:hypothetical protein
LPAAQSPKPVDPSQTVPVGSHVSALAGATDMVAVAASRMENAVRM